MMIMMISQLQSLIPQFYKDPGDDNDDNNDITTTKPESSIL